MSAEHPPQGVMCLENRFDRLPDEIVLAVFMLVAAVDPQSMMTTVHAVCRRWRRLCGDTVGVRLDFAFLVDMHRPKMSVPPVDAAAEDDMVAALAGLARRFKHVVEINLSHYYLLSDIETARYLQASTVSEQMLSDYVAVNVNSVTNQSKCSTMRPTMWIPHRRFANIDNVVNIPHTLPSGPPFLLWCKWNSCALPTGCAARAIRNVRRACRFMRLCPRELIQLAT